MSRPRAARSRYRPPQAADPASIQRTYLVLLLGNTLAASLIWGINTIFLLDAGLSNLEAFAANAFFTAGMVAFEVPTGIVADTVGRRASYLLGTVTLAVSTLAYVGLWQVPPSRHVEVALNVAQALARTGRYADGLPPEAGR